VILVDVNLLLYAHNAGSKEHSDAAAWLERTLSGPEIVGFSWTTILAFLRIATTPRILLHPYELDEATSIIEDWIARPNVAIVGPGDQHWPILKKLLPSSRSRGSLIMDAHLAALAIEHGATLCTSDRDFARFPGLKVEYPILTGIL
jgi:toxin-antitoxin system PIN domain toxin